jgi:WD40 repeat protein
MGMVKSVAYSPDGRQLAQGGIDKIVLVWDPASGQLLGTLTGHQGSAEYVAYSPDGQRLVSADHREVRQWDVTTYQSWRSSLAGHVSGVNCAAYSPDGRRLASGSNDRTVRQWDVETGKQIGAPLVSWGTEEIQCVAYSPDGRRLAAVDYCKVYQWDAITGQESKLSSPRIGYVSNSGKIYGIGGIEYSSDGRYLIAVEEVGMVRSTNGTLPLASRLTHHLPDLSNSIENLSIALWPTPSTNKLDE